MMNNNTNNSIPNPFHDLFEEIKKRDNMYQRDLSFEMMVYSSFKKGLPSKIGNEDWLVQLSDEDKLMLSSTNTDIDLSISTMSEGANLNDRTIVFDDQTGLNAFNIKNSFFISQHTNIGTQYSRITIARAAEIINRNYDGEKPQKFRAIILYNDKIQKIIFHYIFAHFIADKSQRMCIGIVTDRSLLILNGVSFSYHNIRFLVYIYSREVNSSSSYLVVEALDPVKYDEYINASNKILCAIGFFSTIYPFGPYMVFDVSSEQSVFVAYKSCYDKPRTAKYTMLTLNPYAYYSDKDIRDYVFKGVGNGEVNQEAILGVEKELRPVERKHFEKLLGLLDDKRFSDIFYNLQEISTTTLGGNFSSHSISLISYAVCLESVANWFHKSINIKKKAKNTLLSDDIRNTIKQEFLAVLDQYKDIEQEDMTKIRNKITSSLFCKPNADNLSEPFEFFGVELREEDRELLNMRNKILHGEDVLESNLDLDNIVPYLLKAEQYCFGFHSLIWRLIMKAIGYDGVYRDEAKMIENQTTDQSNNGKPNIKRI